MTRFNVSYMLVKFFECALHFRPILETSPPQISDNRLFQFGEYDGKTGCIAHVGLLHFILRIFLPGYVVFECYFLS